MRLHLPLPLPLPLPTPLYLPVPVPCVGADFVIPEALAGTWPLEHSIQDPILVAL